MIVAAAVWGCEGAPNEPAGPSGPKITTQPQDLTLNEGASATFSVAATGTGPLTYQWKRNGSAISGATQPTYSIAAAAAADSDSRFSVVVTDGSQSLESREALLTVRAVPRMTAQPQSRTVLSGTPASFNVTATGTDLSYQWFRDGVAIPEATKASYVVGVPLAGDNGATYSVAVSNPAGRALSAAATLSVNTGAGLRATSYGNAKASGREAVQLPTTLFNARAHGDFFGTGIERDFFVSTLAYDMSKPQSEARPGESQFWRWTGSSYQRVMAKVDDATGCLHPRKAVVADYNGDQKPDVFVVCHGYDAPPFPGEPNYMLLSHPDGVYRRRTVADGLVGFFHSATAFDVNNDGHIDVVLTDTRRNRSVFALINDGQGKFTPRDDLFPIGRANYFSVEAADVDGDGRVDLIAGGHDWENAPTLVLINNGSGSFATVTPRAIPNVPNEGVVLDFVVLDADRNGRNEIYVVRTSGGDGTFYRSRTVQRVAWPTLESTVLVSERGAPWIDFLHPVFAGGRYSLISDNTDRRFSLALP